MPDGSASAAMTGGFGVGVFVRAFLREAEGRLDREREAEGAGAGAGPSLRTSRPPFFRAHMPR